MNDQRDNNDRNNKDINKNGQNNSNINDQDEAYAADNEDNTTSVVNPNPASTQAPATTQASTQVPTQAPNPVSAAPVQTQAPAPAAPIQAAAPNPAPHPLRDLEERLQEASAGHVTLDEYRQMNSGPNPNSINQALLDRIAAEYNPGILPEDPEDIASGATEGVDITTIRSRTNGHTNGNIEGNSNGVFENSTNNTPLDQFNINNILGLDILQNINLSLTNMGLFIILSTILIIYLYVINNNFNKIIPNNTSAVSESIYATVHGIVIGQINDKKGQQYFPLIFVLFIFILTNNLIGMVPYTFATTSHFILTFSLSFTIVLGATYLGLYLHKTEFFSLFVPSGCPLALLYLLVLIEFISYLSRPVSLGLRLAANVLSGHMLLNILSGFTYNIMNSGIIQLLLGLLPLAFVIAFSGLEVGVAFIQAQVFIVLSCSYIKDGLDLH